MSQFIHDMLTGGAPIDGVEKLLDQYGGLPLYVPQQADSEHPIARVAGWDTAVVLSRLYGGERPTLPIGAAIRRERRRREVVRLQESGLNKVEIARRLGMHLRQVQRLADATPPVLPQRDERQMELDLP